MKIVSWNVNSFKTRQDHLVQFLNDKKPDIIGLQELKAETIDTEFLSNIGYHTHYVGQKSYNGVAVLSRAPSQLISTQLQGDDTDTQSRFIEVDYNGVRVINLYLPNGNPVESEKYPYKLNWMHRLILYTKKLRDQRTPFVLVGDFNVIPFDHDCYDPKAWQDDALFRIETRYKFRELINLGLTDTYRALHPDKIEYTFWDYQAGAWPRNNGIRIDHILTSPAMTDRLLSCVIDKTPRGWDKPSDHTPIIAEFSA